MLIHPTLPSGLPASLRGMTAPCHLHRTPRWKLASLLGLALCQLTWS